MTRRIAPLPLRRPPGMTGGDAPPPKAPARAERLEYTLAPDARKAREVVCLAWRSHKVFRHMNGWHDLVELADAMLPYMTEPATVDRLGAAAEAWRAAMAEYRRVEQRKAGYQIGWMRFGAGFVGALPDYAPEHKRQLAAAWDRLLEAVNHATAVGVQKLSAAHPITLLHDPGRGA